MQHKNASHINWEAFFLYPLLPCFPQQIATKWPSAWLAIHYICAGFPDSQMPQFVYEDASVQTDGNLAAHLCCLKTNYRNLFLLK